MQLIIFIFCFIFFQAHAQVYDRNSEMLNSFKSQRAALKENNPDLEFPQVEASANQYLDSAFSNYLGQNSRASCSNYIAEYSKQASLILNMDSKSLTEYFLTTCSLADSIKLKLDPISNKEFLLLRLETKFSDLASSPFRKPSGKILNASKRYDQSLLGALGIKYEDHFLVTQVLILLSLIVGLFSLVRHEKK